MIKILDIICSCVLIISIYLCGAKPKIGWLIYIGNSILYCFLMFYKRLIFMGIAGIILGLIGVKNYLREKK